MCCGDASDEDTKQCVSTGNVEDIYKPENKPLLKFLTDGGFMSAGIQLPAGQCTVLVEPEKFNQFNFLQCRGNSSAPSNSMQSVHLPLMDGLLHLVQRGGDRAGLQPSQAPPRCTKCNSPLINGQCTNHRIVI